LPGISLQIWLTFFIDALMYKNTVEPDEAEAGLLGIFFNAGCIGIL
jgi:hypothetical protein